MNNVTMEIQEMEMDVVVFVTLKQDMDAAQF